MEKLIFSEKFNENDPKNTKTFWLLFIHPSVLGSISKKGTPPSRVDESILKKGVYFHFNRFLGCILSSNLFKDERDTHSFNQ